MKHPTHSRVNHAIQAHKAKRRSWNEFLLEHPDDRHAIEMVAHHTDAIAKLKEIRGEFYDRNGTKIAEITKSRLLSPSQSTG